MNRPRQTDDEDSFIESKLLEIRDETSQVRSAEKTSLWLIRNCTSELVKMCKPGQMIQTHRIELVLNDITTHWIMKFYKNGFNKESEGSTSLLLQLKESTSLKFNVKFNFKIVYLSKLRHETFNCLNGHIESSGEEFANGSEYGAKILIGHDELFLIENGFVSSSGVLKLFCKLTITDLDVIDKKDETNLQRINLDKQEEYKFFVLNMMKSYEPIGLKTKCIKAVINNLSLKNVLETIEVACAIKTETIFHKCLELIIRNYSVICQTKAWKSMPKNIFMKISHEMLTHHGNDALSRFFCERVMRGGK